VAVGEKELQQCAGKFRGKRKALIVDCQTEQAMPMPPSVTPLRGRRCRRIDTE